MNSSTRFWLGIGLWGAAVLWVVSVEVYRGRSRNHSNWLFWLHLTAPIVGIVLMLLGLGIQHWVFK